MSQDLATKIAEWQQPDLLNNEEWGAYEDELRRQMIASYMC